MISVKIVLFDIVIKNSYIFTNKIQWNGLFKYYLRTWFEVIQCYNDNWKLVNKNGWYLYDELLEQYWVVQIGDIQFPQDFKYSESLIGCDTNNRGKILCENFTTDKKNT